MRISQHHYLSPSIFFFVSVVLFGIVLSVFSTSVYGNEYKTLVQKYNETTSGVQIEYAYSITKTASGFILELSSSDLKEKCITDTSYFCMIWEYSCTAKNTQFVAERKNNTIHLVGIFEGQKIDRKIETSNLPWVQFWEYGINNMLESKKSNMEFISIDPSKSEKIRTFVVKRKSVHKIDIDNQEEDAIHLVISIKGLPAFIFHADYWVRETDYLFLRSEMPQGLFAPIIRFQISN